jgi:Rps23 Pro-64 3,4-dihydroxylase Tpa1-like proline 4-hydroxylase
MDIKKYIKVFDNCCKLEQVGNFLKFINNKVSFDDATIIGNGNKPVLNKSVRNTNIWTPSDKNLSDIHWLNFYTALFKSHWQRYEQELNINTCSSGMNRLSVLRYQEGGFYNTHTDYHLKEPRNLSIIFFLNDDYQGGSLSFKDPGNYKKTILEIKPKSARMVMWPSNFLYPHQVTKILKGVRYTIVAWIR